MQPGLAVLGARGNGRLRFGAVGVAVFRKAGFFAERFLVFGGALAGGWYYKRLHSGRKGEPDGESGPEETKGPKMKG